MSAEKLIQLSAPEDCWIFSCSDLHLSSPQGQNQQWVLQKLSEAIKTNFDKPGIIVLNGDIIELWAVGQTLEKTLQVSRDFWKLIRKYAAYDQHEVIYVVGNHDDNLAWDEKSISKIKEISGAKLTLQLEVELSSEWGSNKLIFSHGHQLDPDNHFEDPYDPNDFPFGKHVVRDVIPLAKRNAPKLLKDIEHLIDRNAVAKLIWSLIFYKYVLPLSLIGLGLLVGLVLFSSTSFNWLIYGLSSWLGITFVITLVAVIVVSLKLTRFKLSYLGNDSSKEFLTNTPNSVLGYFDGHTHQPEIKKLNNKLFVNSGYGTVGLIGYPGRLGLPECFVTLRHVSWVELDLSKNKLVAKLTIIKQRISSPGVSKFFCKLPSRQEKEQSFQQTLENVQ